LHNNAFVYPGNGLVGGLINRLVASRILLRTRRALLSRLPFLKLASDVTDVVYCTWIVDVAAVAHLVPPRVTLAQRDGKTLFTVLTYARHHFGPALAGPLWRLFPSPLQSNWRLYVESLPDGVKTDRTVLFVKNIFDNPLYAVGSRLFSDVLPSHFAQRFVHTFDEGLFRTDICGGGSAPDFQCEARTTSTRALRAQFTQFFDSWTTAVEFLSRQHGAIAHVEDCARLAHAQIDLPIDIASVQALAPTPETGGGAFLTRIGAVGEPLCFVVPSVEFWVLSERLF